MRSTDLSKIIIELGHANSQQDELREHCSQKFDQILKFLPQRIVNSDGPDLLGCIFKGISHIPDKGKVIDIVLQTMMVESTSLSHCADVINRICSELPSLPAKDLVKLSNESVQNIINDSDVNMMWRNVLPECSRSLSPYNTVVHCNTEMPTTEYNEQCVHTLCQCQWKERQLVQLAAMFIDMQLPKNSHKQVVNKICSYIIDIPPDTLPPLVHQLLLLCKLYHLDIVLAHLSNYFSTHLFSKLEPPSSDSESTNMDVDEISHHSPEELSRCLSTCVYHMTHNAQEPQLVLKHIKAWPRTQLLRAPFVIDVALALSDKGPDFKSVCLDAIRAAIEQRVVDDLKKKQSAWARAVVPLDVDVVSLLKLLTTESANHRELTVVGLINLAFALLAVPRTKPAAAECWSHGKLVLVRLSKSQPETASYILSQLADKLALDAVRKQYADCLYVLCKLTPASVERCTQLSTILENCQATAAEYRPAAGVLDAVHPLLGYSVRTRDTLLMVCRKGLYSRNSVHRCLALSGFLSVLRHTRLSGAGCSQGDLYSGHSYFTQLTVDMHATQQGNPVTSRVRNEAVCIEVVSILRRCLVQDANVKRLLYTSIYECAIDKAALQEPILEILYEHINKYLSEGEARSPLNLDKCVQLTETTAVLIEPIANLLYTISQFTQGTGVDAEDIFCSQADTGSYLKTKLNKTIEKLCRSEFEIDLENPGLNDLTPVSKAKCIKVQQILQCYEALLAYTVMQWSVDSKDAAAAVLKLFSACKQLLEQTKTSPKLSKKGSNKSLNETKDSAKSQKSQKSQKNKEKGKKSPKLSNMVKDRAGPFKPLPCVWDLKFCVRMIELLYSEEILWSSTEQRNQLIGSREFHHWAVRRVQSVLSEPLDKRAVKPHVLPVTTVLYQRCICRFEAMREFDETTALGCLELFKTGLTLLLSPNYCLKMESFLPTITGQSDAGPAACVAAMLENIHAALLKTETEDEGMRDPMDKKMHASLSSAAALLLELHVESADELDNVMVKLEEYGRCSKHDVIELLGALLSASNARQQEALLLDQLLAKLTTALGMIDVDDTSVVEESPQFPYIDSVTGHAVLNLVCSHLTARFKCAEHLLQRAKDLSAALSIAAGAHALRIDKELNELYKSIVVHACHLCAWCGRGARLRCVPGAGSERVLAACVRLLALLAALTKQIDPRTAVHVRFERLLKLSGKKLSHILNVFIPYLEKSQTKEDKSRVLRDTKLIPRLVRESENFNKQVLILAKKAERDWDSDYLPLGTARDFKIQIPVVEQVLHSSTNDEDDIADDTED